MTHEVHKDKIVMRAGRYDLEPKRAWSSLIRGVRVEGDTVVISVKGGNRLHATEWLGMGQQLRQRIIE